jgi:hypothetical protein
VYVFVSPLLSCSLYFSVLLSLSHSPLSLPIVPKLRCSFCDVGLSYFFQGLTETFVTSEFVAALAPHLREFSCSLNYISTLDWIVPLVNLTSLGIVLHYLL